MGRGYSAPSFCFAGDVVIDVNWGKVSNKGLREILHSIHIDRRKTTGSLVPADADEAKTMIPSLANKISDEELKDLCDQMEDLRRASERDAR